MTKDNEKRLELFPNTDYFIYDNLNPKKNIVGDCVIRALAGVTNLTWEKVLVQLTATALDRGFDPLGEENVTLFLKENGFHKCKEKRHPRSNKRYFVKEFCKLFAENNKVYYMNAGTNHVICIKNKKVHDIWYSQNEVAHSYWEKEV